MAILVTGAAGFIGSSLVDALLKDGKNVIGIDNFSDFYAREIKERDLSRARQNDNFKFYEIDLCDAAALKTVFDANDIETVVHLAARAGVRPSIERPVDYCQTNIIGSINVLEEMRSHNLHKLVFASSSSVYGNCKAEVFTEDLKVTEPISQYAATKSAMEQFCYTYHKLYDINTICLRFFTVYGPAGRPDMAYFGFTNKLRAGDTIQIFNYGNCKRDFTYVDDIVEGVKRVMQAAPEK